MVLVCNLGASEVKVMVYHFQSCMAEYFTKREDIPAIEKVIVYVVSESGTIKPSKIVDTLKAMSLLPGGPIIVPSCF